MGWIVFLMWICYLHSNNSVVCPWYWIAITYHQNWVCMQWDHPKLDDCPVLSPVESSVGHLEPVELQLLHHFVYRILPLLRYHWEMSHSLWIPEKQNDKKQIWYICQWTTCDSLNDIVQVAIYLKSKNRLYKKSKT